MLRVHARIMPGTRRGKALESKASDAARTFARGLVDRDFNGNVSNAAKAMGVAQPTLAEFLNRKRQLGVVLWLALAEYSGRSLDEIAGRKPETTLPAMKAARVFLGARVTDAAEALLMSDAESRGENPSTWDAQRCARELLATEASIAMMGIDNGEEASVIRTVIPPKSLIS